LNILDNYVDILLLFAARVNWLLSQIVAAMSVIVTW